MLTPQEAAKLVDWPDASRNKEIHDFVLNASAKEVQLFIHSIQSHSATANDWLTRSRMALDIRLAEGAEVTAKKLVTGTDNLVTQTEKLVKFTKALVCLTIALAILALLEFLKFFFKCH